MEIDMPVGSGEPEHWHPHPTRPTRPASVSAPVGVSAIETSMTVGEHEAASQHRYDKLCHKLKKVKEEIMSTPDVNVYQKDPMSGVMPLLMGGGYGGGGTGAAIGGGLGAGLLGGVLGGALLGGNGGGLFGGRNGGNVEGVVTPALLAASLAQVTDTSQNTTVLQSLGDIKASVPLAEGQVQLAIAGAVGEIRSHLGAVENGLVSGQSMINKNISDAIASSLASQNNINVNVLTQGSQTRESVAAYGVANLNATKDAQFATAAAISQSTKEVLAAINDQNISNLQRQLTVAETALLERNATLRGRETEINVTQTVNQNQAQMQTQQQQQQQAILLNNIWTQMAGMQQAIATNSNMIIGNTGATTTGPQTANPVNVRT
jgi:hypothetical protein